MFIYRTQDGFELTGLWFGSTRVVFWAAAVLLPQLIPTHQSAQLTHVILVLVLNSNENIGH